MKFWGGCNALATPTSNSGGCNPPGVTPMRGSIALILLFVLALGLVWVQNFKKITGWVGFGNTET
jgi:hypothetical protein